MKEADSTRAKTELVVNILDDVAKLIGEFRTTPALLSNGLSITPGLGMTTDEIALQRRANDIRMGLFTIMVMGKFKNGKSTLINALLGKELVRTRAIPTTAVITVIVHGENPKVALFEHGNSKPRLISWQAFQTDYSLTNEDEDEDVNIEDRFGNIDFAQIETEHSFIAQGVKLVDSPGLEEDSARSGTTLRFLKQAQAVIFVLDATHLLDEKERKLIREQLGEGRLDHVFFVINRINNLDEADELDEIHQRAQKILSRHFTDNQGRFDEKFYKRRVFFVNAYAALFAHKDNDLDELAYKNSGVAALDTEIEQFLNGEDRFRAVIGSSVQALIGILADAHNQIQRRRVAIKQPLLNLQERYKSAKERIKEVEPRCQQIGNEVANSGKKLNKKITQSLQNHVSIMEQSWEKESQRLMPMAAIQLSDLLQCAVSEDAKKRVVNIIQEDINIYLNHFLESWSDKVIKELAQDITLSENQALQSVQVFLKQLNQIQDEFAFGKMPTGLKIANNFNFRPSNAFVKNIGGSSDEWSSIIQGSIMELLLSIGVWIWALFNPLILMAAIASALMGMSFANPMRILENFKMKIRKNIGNDIHSKIRTENKLSKNIHQNINNYFQTLGEDVSSQLHGRLKDATLQMRSIVEELQNGSNFSITEENARLDAIVQQLEHLFNQIGISILGRSYRITEFGMITGK